MEKPKVIFKHTDLSQLLNRESIITDTLVYIINHIEELPEYIDTIGIANNYMLGVFGITYNNGIYESYRIYYDNNQMIVSPKGYPVSNMCTSNVDCNMDYIISLRLLKRFYYMQREAI